MHNLRAFFPITGTGTKPMPMKRMWVTLSASTTTIYKHQPNTKIFHRLVFLSPVIYIHQCATTGFHRFYGIKYNLLNHSRTYRMYHRWTTAMPTKGKWNDIFFCVRLTRFRSSKIKRPFLIDVANDKRTQIPFACRLAFATFFFFSARLIYSITCYTNNCIIKDLYLPHSELWYYYSSHLCAHTGYDFVGNTHTNIANDYRVSLSELCVGLLCASNE